MGRESADFDMLDIARCSRQRVAHVLEQIKQRVSFMFVYGDDYHDFVRDCLGTRMHNGWGYFIDWPGCAEAILFKIEDVRPGETDA